MSNRNFDALSDGMIFKKIWKPDHNEKLRQSEKICAKQKCHFPIENAWGNGNLNTHTNKGLQFISQSLFRMIM